MKENTIGLAVYQGNTGERRPGVKQIFEMMLRRAQLRSLLEIEASKIAEAIPHLSADETRQLQSMLSDEVVAADADVAALAQQIDREAALAASTKAMDASRVLQGEMMRRIDRQGFCPAPSQLAGEAIARAYGGQ